MSPWIFALPDEPFPTTRPLPRERCSCTGVLSFQSSPRAKSTVPLQANPGLSYKVVKCFYSSLSDKRLTQSQNQQGACKKGSDGVRVIAAKNRHLHISPCAVTSLCDFQHQQVPYKPTRDAQRCPSLSHSWPRTLQGVQHFQTSPCMSQVEAARDRPAYIDSTTASQTAFS